ncbi:hypothetical protein Tco_1045089 [Tanacetum coccineum]|uniref:Secreted protein n=1 Tax=Tanacetum coccineum TaxID=301880 RepID=A0ABQ5GSV1_9ASTR
MALAVAPATALVTVDRPRGTTQVVTRDTSNHWYEDIYCRFRWRLDVRWQVVQGSGVQYEARITEPIIGSVIDRSRRPRDTHSLVDLSINCLAAVAILGTDSHGNNSQSFEVARSKITKIPLLGGL